MSLKIASLLVVAVAANGCSGESSTKGRRDGDARTQAGEGGEPAVGGSTTSMGGSSGAGGSGGSAISAGTGGDLCNIEREPWIALDAADCAERPLGDCTGMACAYSSSIDFGNTPALSECGRYVSYDGCARLTFDFDSNGCAVNVGPPPGGRDSNEHLGDLRECMILVFASGRFPCLASRTLSFFESCFIH